MRDIRPPRRSSRIAPYALVFVLSGCAASPASAPPASPAAAPDVSAVKAPPEPSADPHLFVGCKASPAGGVGWNYMCDGMAASLADFVDARPEAMLGGVAAGFREALDGKEGKVDEKDATYVLVGKERRGRRITLVSAGATLANADAAVVPVEGRGLRLVTCGGAPGRGEARCPVLLEALAREPWRADAVAGVPVTSDAVSLAGRPVEVPAGCHAAAHEEKDARGATIWCDGKLALLWAEGKGADKLSGSDLFTRGGAHTQVACAVESVSATCDRTSDATGTLLRASAKVRGRSVALVCASQKAEGGLPPACASVLTLPASP